ncbi:chromosomal replication initiator protein DnaA [Patescibacteria group bacterium]|nr:chromosomal replication initiator protein DnaA [Patescibacteria group bacterium]
MTKKDFWIAVLNRLKPTISRAHFVTWFNKSTILSNENGTVLVGVPSIFSFDWLAKKYDLKISQAIKELDKGVTKVVYEVHPRLSELDSTEGVDVKALFMNEDKKVRKVRNVAEVRVSSGPDRGYVESQMLNGRYSLHSFVVGQENRLPHAACSAVSNHPGGIYNPLYIYGTVGLGKTHLLQSIGNEILQAFPNKVVKYVTAEKFVTEVVEAIGSRNMKRFKDQYRKVDVFLVDDVQFFGRKNSSQQEFFHTFNELYDSNKQIVLTSDRAPSDLDDLDDRLISRFGMGMVVELLPPEYETRVAILSQKCGEYQMILDPKVVDFIAMNVCGSVRDLEGVLKQLMAEAQLAHRVPTIKTVVDVIRRLNKAQKIIGYDVEKKAKEFRTRTAEDVQDMVANYYGVAVDALTGGDRHKEIMVPRQICMYLIKNELNESYEKIGLAFGGRNHTTVMHACNKTSKALVKDIKLVKDLNSIKREMGL